jgi:hypothetical protein
MPNFKLENRERERERERGVEKIQIHVFVIKTFQHYVNRYGSTEKNLFETNSS